MAFPDLWSELALVSIQSKGGSVVDYAAAILTVDLNQGDKAIKVSPNIEGGRVVKFIPEEPTVITMEGHFVELDTASNSGIHQLFHTTRGNWDTGDPLTLQNSTNRDQFAIAIMWTNDVAATSAAGSTAVSTDSFRFYAENAYFVSLKDVFTDGLLKHTLKFEIPPFTELAQPNLRWDSGDQTALSARSTYA